MSGRREEQKKVPGFTFVELLVVIAMIAILAGLLLPTLARARAKGQAMVCLNNERQLSLAYQFYADDSRNRFAYNLGTAEIKRLARTKEYINWTTPVMSWELDTDNTNTVLLTQGGIGDYLKRSARVYRCPSDSVVSDLQSSAGWSARVRSFSVNAMVGDAGEFSRSGSNLNNPFYVQFFKATDVTKPSKIFVFTEEHPDSINDGYFLNKLDEPQWIDLPASYHLGAANLSYVDGHAAGYKWRFAMTTPPPRPDAAQLPLPIPAGQRGDFYWLMAHTSLVDYYASDRR